jgi:hypothetical protein
LAELVIDNRKDHFTKTHKPVNVESESCGILTKPALGTAFAVFAGFKEITFKILKKKYRSKKPRKILKYLN